MSNKDAAMFPLIASVALFGIYIFFKVCCLKVMFTVKRVFIIGDVVKNLLFT